MITWLYQALAHLGYTHPLHPPLTHLPTGLVLGAFIFAVAARAMRRPNLALTGRHCIALALISVLPTMLLGLLDWQRFYAGAWIFPIRMKLGLALSLIILLIAADVQGRMVQRKSRGFPTIYILCVLNVVALGYFGGELVFFIDRLFVKINLSRKKSVVPGFKPNHPFLSNLLFLAFIQC